MTTDFGMVDLKEQSFAPLSLHAAHRYGLIKTITEIMVAFNASPAEVLSLYTQAPVIWEIPSLYMPKLISTALTVSVPEVKGTDSQELYKLYRKLARVVKKRGFGPEAEAIAVRALSPKVLHPMVFTRTAQSPGASALFGLEWACLLSYHAKATVFQDNHAFVRLSSNSFLPPMGVIRGQCEAGYEVNEDFLQSAMQEPRGFIDFGTFDAIDRAHLWVMQNFNLLTDPEKMIRGLCLLKLVQSPKVAYEFEQALRNLTAPVFVEPTLKSLMYGDESLDAVRDIWYDRTKPAKDKFYLLHEKLVPGYLDDKQFESMFKRLPAPEERFTYKMERDVAVGMEKFVALFLQTRRAIADGKRILMK